MKSARRIAIGMAGASPRMGATYLAAAHAAYVNGADFFTFSPDHIDPASETIEGQLFRAGRWVRQRMPFPDVVENPMLQDIATDAWQALVRRCRITSPYLGGKVAIDQQLRKSGRFDEILIHTAPLEGQPHLLAELDRCGRVVVKPEFGLEGRGVVYVGKQGRGFLVNADETNHRFTGAELEAFLAPRLKAERHVVQDYVESRTALGQPFDIRIHLRRDGSAQWRRVRIIARIGSGASIAANMATGGSVTELEPFLEHRFGAAAGSIRDMLVDISEWFPPAMQSLYPGRTISALGLDIGLDQKGRPHLFEVNSNPTPRYAPFTDAMWRIGYAIYLARNPGAPDGAIRDLASAVSEAGAPGTP